MRVSASTAMILCRKSYEETVEQSAKVCESIAAVEPSCSCSPGALSHMWITWLGLGFGLGLG